MVNTRTIIKIIYEFCKKNHLSISKYAKMANVSKSWLSKLWHTEASISLDLAQQVLKPAGYVLELNKKSRLLNKHIIVRKA